MALISNLNAQRRLAFYLLVLGAAVLAAGILWVTCIDPPVGEADIIGGEAHLSAGAYEDALKAFENALRVEPHHHGALLGKAAALIRLERFDDAEQALNRAIKFISISHDPNDPTDRGALATAYGRRGVVHDRQGRYEQALEDYVESMKADAGLSDTAGVFDRLMSHEGRTSTIRDRAEYLFKQLQLPEDQRQLRQQN